MSDSVPKDVFNQLFTEFKENLEEKEKQAEKIGRLEERLNNCLTPWMRKTKCVLKVRELIERYENQFAPNYKPVPPPNANVGVVYNYHKEKWVSILQNNPNNDNRVVNLRCTLQNKNISWDQFASIMSDIYAVTSKAIHFPAGVQNVTGAEVIQTFEDDYQYVDVVQKGCLEVILAGL